MIFADCHDAGRLLGERLADLRLKHPVMLARSRELRLRDGPKTGGLLDVFVGGKIGHPNQPEFGIGALAEEEAPVLDEPVRSRSMLGRPRALNSRRAVTIHYEEHF